MSSDPAFVNSRLLEYIEKGARGGPSFHTTVLQLGNGTEVRNADWSRSRGEWNIGYGVMYKTESNAAVDGAFLDTVLDMFYNCQGKAHGFRFKDWSDYQIGAEAPQVIGAGDGSTTSFQVYRRYTVDDVYFDRKITRLVEGSLTVYVAGTATTDYSVDVDTGIITFTTAPASGSQVTVTCEFDVPVRFNTDHLETEMYLDNVGAVPQIEIIELKE